MIDRLAQDLRLAFTELKGFSPRNLKYMRALAEAYPDEQFVQQVVAQIPWGHNQRILDAVSEPAEREWYIPKTSITFRSEIGQGRDDANILHLSFQLFHHVS